MRVPQVRVGEILELHRRAVPLRPEASYSEIGIRSFGRGVFLKNPVTGSDLGTKKVYEIHPGDLLLSNVFAWEGAVAVAGPETEGRIGSHRFMTWAPLSDEVDVNYLAQLFVSEPGLEMIGRASPGSAGRNRTLGIKNFEKLVIPLPDLAEQRRIAARLDHIAVAKDSLSRHAARRSNASSAIDARIQELLWSGCESAPLGELVQVNPRRTPINSQTVTFVPMAAVNGVTGRIDQGEPKDLGSLRKGYTQFTRGDVIFARITPCMQNGKSALFDYPDREYGYGSTEFHVLRARDAAPSARWIHSIVRSKWFRDSAVQHMTGTAGQQRVPSSWLRNVLAPLPPKGGEARLLASISRLVELRLELYATSEAQDARAARLLPAARNEEFAKLM